jgi:Flp pilus assembly protein CpaB
MEAHSHFGKVGGGRSGQVLTNRKSSVFVALLSAAMAGVLIYLFVSHYDNKPTTVVAPPATATVYVPKQYIPAGTPESSIASGNLLKPEVVPASQVTPGAIANPATIAGEVSAAPMVVGQQITATDFSHTNVTIGSYLKGDERAVAVAMKTAQGLTAYLHRGDTIDVMAQGPGGTDELFQNVTVLGNLEGNVVLELTDKQSLALAEAVGANLNIWFELRPVTGATDSVSTGYVEKL